MGKAGRVQALICKSLDEILIRRLIMCFHLPAFSTRDAKMKKYLWIVAQLTKRTFVGYVF
jgi:hypothetical protein